LGEAASREFRKRLAQIGRDMKFASARGEFVL
jgi:hypothetical protein